MPTRVTLPPTPPPKKASTGGLKKALLSTAAVVIPAAVGAIVKSGVDKNKKRIDEANEEAEQISLNMGEMSNGSREQRSKSFQRILNGGSAMDSKRLAKRALIATALGAAAYGLTKLAQSYAKGSKQPSDAEIARTRNALRRLGLDGKSDFHEVGSLNNDDGDFHRKVAALRGGMGRIPAKYKETMRTLGGNVVQAFRGNAKRITAVSAALGLAVTAALMTNPAFKDSIRGALRQTIPEDTRTKIQSYITGINTALGDVVERVRPTATPVRGAGVSPKRHFSSVLS
jgi:hypothetical protein